MPRFMLSRELYRDKVYGGWLGRNAGGTLGAPYEGKKETLSLAFYQPVPGQPAANEDLDLQLVALHALREHGPGVSALEIANLWARHVCYTFDEFGYATRNLRRGLRPPVSGWHDNYFRHGSGAMGRSQIWAMVAPAAPHVAASYAYRDASLDHAGEGVWAAMFWAAVQSAAFATDDRQALIEIGLGMIPGSCQVAQAVRDACEAHLLGRTWLEARVRIIAAVGSDIYSDAPQNTGFAMLGWLYGNGDFASTLCHAANCGFDCDGTAGTIGATMGILLGKTGLPAEWTTPIGDAVVLGWGVVDLDVERNVAELTEHTAQAAERVVEERCPEVQFVDTLDSHPPVPEAEPVPAVEVEAPRPAAQGASEPGALAQPAVGSVREEEPADAAPAASHDASVDLAPPPPPGEVSAEGSTAEPGLPDQATPTAEDEGSEGLQSPPGTQGPPGQAPAHPATEPLTWLTRFEEVRPLWTISPTTAVYRQGDFELEVDYGEAGPAIVPNAGTTLIFSVRNLGESDFLGNVRISTPAGWDVRVPGAQGQRQMLARGGMARYGFVIRCPEQAALAARNSVSLVLTPEKGMPTLLEVPLLGGHCWHYVGPLANSHLEGYERSFEPESKPSLQASYLGRGGAMVTWQRIAFRETVMDVEPLFDRAPGVLYLRTVLQLGSALQARIIVHCNDGVRAWLNGNLLLQRHSHDEFHPTLGSGPSMAETSLKQGLNLVVLKVVRCKDPVRLAFLVTDLKGRPLDDLGNTRWVTSG